MLYCCSCCIAVCRGAADTRILLWPGSLPKQTRRDTWGSRGKITIIFWLSNKMFPTADRNSPIFFSFQWPLIKGFNTVCRKTLYSKVLNHNSVFIHKKWCASMKMKECLSMYLTEPFIFPCNHVAMSIWHAASVLWVFVQRGTGWSPVQPGGSLRIPRAKCGLG